MIEQNEVEIGKTTVRILIPSRRKDGAIVSPEIRSDWDSRARRHLETSPFGGATPSHVIGSFVHAEDGRVTREEITVLSSSCSVATLLNEEARLRIFTFAKELCAALGQESIFVGWGDQAFVVSQAFELHTIPVIRFTELSPLSQSKHLTMGWGGIDDPKKMLQVLSLDGWTLPSVAQVGAATSPSLQLQGVLVDGGPNVRRAWRWERDTKKALTGLQPLIRTVFTEGTPSPGDLIFFRSKQDFIDVVMVSEDGKLLGPRDLRQSHGRLNPVTRHLLFRMLRRDWAGLGRDLEQKPLDQRFFPKLQALRKQVEDAVSPPVASVSPRRAAATGARGQKKKGSAVTAQEAAAADGQRLAFRSSVLVVGRMMFLRFLAQKGWLPGGVDRLLEAFSNYGERYFREYISPLWFDVLNTPVADRSAGISAKFPGDYPYLNGGLFVPRVGEHERDLPGKLFDPNEDGSFLRIFRDFEFSLNEYAGSDESLRIDPSFFGKALESFNAADEKKKEGVHYTPKPIAWALAFEGIVARISQLSGVDRARIEGLVRGERSLTGAEASRIQNSLRKLHIIDPAVGSGVLLWSCLEVLLALDSACDGIAGGGDGYQRGSYRWGERSRHFVCNCLCGVDISEEAVELTRLRLWLAVALSEDTAKPLPDLELNIHRADSLGEPTRNEGVGAGHQMNLGLDAWQRVVNELEKLTADYNRMGEEEPEVQRDILRKIKETRRELARQESDVVQGRKSQVPDLQFAWKTFFPHVFYGPGKGFDLVIANPPYVRVQQVPEDQRTQYRKNWASMNTGSGDLSYGFVELALRTLAAPNGGQLAFIQPNFRHHDAARKLRGMLAGLESDIHSRLRLWVDFGDAQVFPTATNYVAMIFAERRDGQVKTSEFHYTNPKAGSWIDNSDNLDLSWLRPKEGVHVHPASDEWLTLPPALREAVLTAQSSLSRRLDDIAKVEVGLQTSSDRVFLFTQFREIDDDYVDVVLDTSKKGRESKGRIVRLERAVVRTCQKGSVGNGYRLLFPYDARGDLIPLDTMKTKFPLAWRYLNDSKSVLEARENGAFTGPNWHRYGRSEGFLASQTPKVLVPAILNKVTAIVDADGSLAFTASGKGGGGAWAVTPKPGSGYTLEQIAAILTSEVAWNHILAYGSPQQGGWLGVDASVLKEIPV